ncbi:MAG: hypothetical protein ABI836_00685 [Gemmatimonadota bacterium]
MIEHRGPEPPFLSPLLLLTLVACSRAPAVAFTWTGDAVVHAGGQTVDISGQWQVQPPDTAIVTTWLRAAGPATARSLILAAPRGWTETGDSLSPMPSAMLANERDEFYLYQLIRLMSRGEKRSSLIPIAADTLGQQGFRAERVGRPAADLFLGHDGRLAHVRFAVTGAGSGKTAIQDVWLEGEITHRGVHWPARIRIDQDGEPYFDLVIHHFQVVPPLQDPRLKGAHADPP